MAVRPGEENVATLFGDVHYFYGQPTDKPRHHRFDKGSYIYLFEDANNRRARVEIANQPGTDDQDAFDGFLDKTQIRYSYKQTCMVSVTIGDVPNQEEWHLPTFDPQNQSKYHYKLESLDIYFWTQQDALQFVNGIRRVLPPAQVEVLDEPGPPPPRQASDMSSVVQKLEQAAISDTAAAQKPQQANGGAPSFAPPPMSAVSGGSGGSPPHNFAPIAYNPAAPAAPESIQHREKTPPPEDGGMNPLHQTLAYDATTPFSPGLVPTGLGPLSPGIPPPPSMHSPPGAPSFPAPPQHSVTSPGLPPPGFGQGHTHPGLVRAATMPVHGLPSPGLASPFGAGYPGSPGVPAHQQPGMPTHHTPTPPVTSPGLPPPPPPPAGGYSSYNYAASQGQQQQQPAAGAGAQNQAYSVHQQHWQPTEGEHAVKYKPKTEPRGRLEENAGRLERGVSGMFKKFEKKFG
ncbi:uncharacterized protein E0L32_011240 [Thyridium curvatum]|uniref:RNA recognition motif-containing protein n=1 Tax=Thyridium curvatum TaxID=1093900 RepID=A0A507BNF5_9PEZI|nr:uncharacterized protein E0L32_011240 [Thyridium curvatum]TPX19079.1 hypothetical protein E0L32_011240 [Thyridium curvatum]